MSPVTKELLTQLSRVEQRYRQRSAQRMDRTLDLDLSGLGDGSLRPIEQSIEDLGGMEAIISNQTVLRLPRSQSTFAQLGFERILAANDLMEFSFLEAGGRAGRAVGRVSIGGATGSPLGFGTGFLVSPRLLLTNNHVLRNEGSAGISYLEMDYVMDPQGRPSTPVRFRIAPREFFVTDSTLDFTLVAVETVSLEGRELREWGQLQIAPPGQPSLTERLNIIQHPGGRPKQVAIRANEVVDLMDAFVHYQTDTQPGSSGSPVFDDLWRLVALHHAGVPARNEAGRILTRDGRIWQEEMGEEQISWIANEGVLCSAILDHLGGLQLSDEWAARVQDLKKGAGEIRLLDRRSESGGGDSSGAGATTLPDGSVQITVPLTINLRLGGGAAIAVQTPTPATLLSNQLQPTVVQEPDPGAPSALSQAVEALRTRYQGDQSVVEIRPGWVFEGGWITNTPAIVIVTRKKLAPFELNAKAISRFPTDYQGWRVEVEQASPRDLLPEGSAPDFTESTRTISYEPPPGGGLAELEAPMRVNCHVSPDAGWPVLKEWLAGTEERLTVGMYDFTAPHIASTLLELFRESGTLSLCIQKGQAGGGSPSRPENEILDDLRASMGDRFDQGFADVKRKGALWATDYHIKVAVRDGRSIWLSSGNWQSSGQPDRDPFGEELKTWSGLNRSNREWHVIVENEALAAEFERYLRHDLASSRAARQAAGVDPQEALAQPLPDLFVQADWDRDPQLLEVAPQWIPPQTFEADPSAKVRLQPLLTPDNYWEHVEALILSARSRVWIQNQTFKPVPGMPKNKGLYRIMKAVKDQQDRHLDVRIIFRKIGASADIRKNLEWIKDFGVDPANVRLQSGCHTKGVLIDEDKVLVGSHNWSESGVLVNRDASLIFFHEGIARSFERAFLYDWEQRSSQSISAAPVHERLALAGEPTPEGFVRVSWRDFMGD